MPFGDIPFFYVLGDPFKDLLENSGSNVAAITRRKEPLGALGGGGGGSTKPPQSYAFSKMSVGGKDVGFSYSLSPAATATTTTTSTTQLSRLNTIINR